MDNKELLELSAKAYGCEGPEFAQQSQAVADCDHLDPWQIAEGTKCDCNKSQSVVISKKENTITEQDAQQIALSFYWFVENFKAQNGRNPSVVDWYDVVGCMMINKLNEGKNHGN